MQLIVLVGTCHTVQIPENDGAAEFSAFIRTLYNRYGVRAIGEEHNRDALAEKGGTTSVCREIATALDLSHRYCDPTRDQRKALGVLQESNIRIRAWQEEWPPEKIQSEVRASHSIRERWWRDQLVDLNCWPALFICGAEHAPYFRALLEEHGFSVVVAANDWEPDSKANST